MPNLMIVAKQKNCLLILFELQCFFSCVISSNGGLMISVWSLMNISPLITSRGAADEILAGASQVFPAHEIFVFC